MADYNYNNGGNGPDPSAYPRKWFKFLIYFLMWINALSLFVTGFRMVTGTLYEENIRDAVYATFSGLKTVDVLFGLVFIVLAVAIIYDRFRLAGFYQNGPKLYLLFYGINLAASVIYYLAVLGILGEDAKYVDNQSVIISIVTSLVMLIINKIYFDKRKELFRN